MPYVDPTSPRGIMLILGIACAVVAIGLTAIYFMAPATAARDRLDTIREHVATVMQPVWLDALPAPHGAEVLRPAAAMRKALAATSLLPELTPRTRPAWAAPSAILPPPVRSKDSRRYAVRCANCYEQFNPQTPHGMVPVVNCLADGAHAIGFEAETVARKRMELAAETARVRYERQTAAGWRPGTGGDGLPPHTPKAIEPPPVIEVVEDTTVITAGFPAEVVTKTPKHARDLFGNDGADESWADVLHNMPEGEIERRGVSTHPGPAALTDDEITDAWYGAKFQALDKELERQRNEANARWVDVFGPEWLDECNAIRQAEIDEQARHDANLLAAEIDLLDISGEIVLGPGALHGLALVA